MTPAHVVQITTPKDYILNGLWFGPKKPKKAIIWVHGLGASVFSKLDLIQAIVDPGTAVLAFNNRGFERVAQIRKRSDAKPKRLLAGAAHERFTDCVDDIDGAVNFLRKHGVKDIYLAGHSTGCQKSIYWASKKGKGVKGLILLAPVSDYASALKNHGAAKLSQVAKYARSLVGSGKPQELLPSSMWSDELDDAQRFLSLYTPDSVEEIFSYAQPKKRATTLQRVTIPTLVLWAEHDEYADRPAEEIAEWFARNMRNKHVIVTVPKVGHGFRGGEKRVVKELAQFIKTT